VGGRGGSEARLKGKDSIAGSVRIIEKGHKKILKISLVAACATKRSEPGRTDASQDIEQTVHKIKEGNLPGDIPG